MDKDAATELGEFSLEEHRLEIHDDTCHWPYCENDCLHPILKWCYGHMWYIATSIMFSGEIPEDEMVEID